MQGSFTALSCTGMLLAWWCFGLCGLALGLMGSVYLCGLAGLNEAGLERVTGQESERRHPRSGGTAVATRRSFAGMAFPASVLGAEGMGRERRARGFRSGDSGHGRGCGRGSAPSSHGCGHGSPWGALLRQGRRRSRLGEGRGGCGGAHRRRNRAKMAWLGRSTAAFVTLFLLEEQRRGN